MAVVNWSSLISINQGGHLPAWVHIVMVGEGMQTENHIFFSMWNICSFKGTFELQGWRLSFCPFCPTQIEQQRVTQKPLLPFSWSLQTLMLSVWTIMISGDWWGASC